MVNCRSGPVTPDTPSGVVPELIRAVPPSPPGAITRPHDVLPGSGVRPRAAATAALGLALDAGQPQIVGLLELERAGHVVDEHLP